MLNIEQLTQELLDLKERARRALDDSERKHDNRAVFQGIDAAGRNLMRMYEMTIGSDIQERLKRLEEQEDRTGREHT